MHGAAVASIAVGKSVGVAPDAQVDYYSAVNASQNPDEIKEYKANIRKEIEAHKDNTDYVRYLQQELQNAEAKRKLWHLLLRRPNGRKPRNPGRFCDRGTGKNIPNRIDIDFRMQEANLRSEIGHFEADSIESRRI